MRDAGRKIVPEPALQKALEIRSLRRTAAP